MPWRQLTYKQRQAAPAAMARCLAFPPPPGFPADLQWAQAFDRFGWRGKPWKALGVPQTRDCRKAAQWREERAAGAGALGTRVLVTNTAYNESLAGLDGVIFFGDGGVDNNTLVSCKDVRCGKWDWCVVDCAPVPDGTRVVLATADDMRHLPLLVQLFPLLHQPAARLPVAVHPHTRRCLEEYAQGYWDWKDEYAAAVDAEKKRPRDERTWDTDDYRAHLRQRDAFAERALELEALKVFPSMGSDFDPGDHAGDWLAPRCPT